MQKLHTTTSIPRPTILRHYRFRQISKLQLFPENETIPYAVPALPGE